MKWHLKRNSYIALTVLAVIAGITIYLNDSSTPPAPSPTIGGDLQANFHSYLQTTTGNFQCQGWWNQSLPLASYDAYFQIDSVIIDRINDTKWSLTGNFSWQWYPIGTIRTVYLVNFTLIDLTGNYSINTTTIPTLPHIFYPPELPLLRFDCKIAYNNTNTEDE